mgnify:CR=1 FL=1
MDNLVMTAKPVRVPRRLNRRVLTIVVCAVIAVLLLAILISGICITDDMVAPNFAQKNQAPSMAHMFGTDWLGRDMFLRTVKGLSLSIVVGSVGSAVSAVLATAIGIAAAMGSKWLDSAVNWCIDLVMGVPHMVLLILVSFACGKGLTGLLVGLAVTHWTSLARLMRSEVMQIRAQQYIAVSRRLGHGSWFILTRHLLPHLVPQFLVGLILLFPHAILHESALSFLGFGLSPEQPAIGIILSESMKYLSSGMWWLAVFPGLLLVLLVVLFEKLGDHLRKIVDPYCAQE